ncbi:MAG: hypothetical protein HGB05_08680 [Chloroflexi bacterium]|nr:hypothetical protein [Chloroflexota bacterium]
MNNEALGTLSDGPRDDRLQATDDRLKRPRGALLAFRQSGGFRFSTREVIVYTDGRVIARRQGKLDAGEGSRRITAAEVAELKEMIKQSGLFGLPRSIGRQSPDGYAYELIARLGRKSKSIEFFDGSIPSEVQPLLAQLKTLTTVYNAQE